MFSNWSEWRDKGILMILFECEVKIWMEYLILNLFCAEYEMPNTVNYWIKVMQPMIMIIIEIFSCNGNAGYDKRMYSRLKSNQMIHSRPLHCVTIARLVRMWWFHVQNTDIYSAGPINNFNKKKKNIFSWNNEIASEAILFVCLFEIAFKACQNHSTVRINTFHLINSRCSIRIMHAKDQY